MIDGLSLLGWILGGSFLAGCWMFAVALHTEPTDMDRFCSQVDQELDAEERQAPR